MWSIWCLHKLMKECNKSQNYNMTHVAHPVHLSGLIYHPSPPATHSWLVFNNQAMSFHVLSSTQCSDHSFCLECLLHPHCSLGKLPFSPSFTLWKIQSKSACQPLNSWSHDSLPGPTLLGQISLLLPNNSNWWWSLNSIPSWILPALPVASKSFIHWIFLEHLLNVR